MSDPTSSTPNDPQKAAADATAKKQTVRISLPPKPSAGPSIKVPTAPAASAPIGSGGAAKVTQVIQAPPPPTKPSGGMATSASAHATPSAAPASKPAPAQRPVRSSASISGLDKGLAIATAVFGILAVLRLVFIDM